VTYNWKEDHTAPEFAHCPADTIMLPCNAPRQPMQERLLRQVQLQTTAREPYLWWIACADRRYICSTSMTGYSSGVSILNFSLGSFTGCYPPPTTIGQTDTHTYSSVATFEISQDGGKSWTPVSGNCSDHDEDHESG